MTARKQVPVNKINTMSAKEMGLAERTAGLSLSTLEDPNYPKAELLAALGWVIAKRTDKELKYEDYADKTLEEITKDLGLDV